MPFYCTFISADPSFSHSLAARIALIAVASIHLIQLLFVNQIKQLDSLVDPDSIVSSSN